MLFSTAVVCSYMLPPLSIRKEQRYQSGPGSFGCCYLSISSKLPFPYPYGPCTEEKPPLGPLPDGLLLPVRALPNSVLAPCAPFSVYEQVHTKLVPCVNGSPCHGRRPLQKYISPLFESSWVLLYTSRARHVRYGESLPSGTLDRK